MRAKLLVAVAFAIAAGALAGVAGAATIVQPLVQRGTTVFQNTPVGGTQALPSSGQEFPAGAEGDGADGHGPGAGPGSADRRHGHGHKGGPLKAPSAKSSPVLAGATTQSFAGVDGFDQRYANGGNQYSVEPPDQGLCVGNGYVVEPVNDVIAVYSAAGGARLKSEDLNSFYGYAPQYNRHTRTAGPQVTDPSCLYDTASGKFIVDVLTYEVDAAGNPTGVNHIDLAVSQTGDPTGTWDLYSFAAQDDGTQGTPSHPNCPCIGDYPHVGMDANGYFLTTNEYPWFVDGFNGAQVYAISKRALTGGAFPVGVVHVDDLNIAGNPSFTVWPANANPVDYDQSGGGTEYFLSSMATPEANNADGIDNRIGVWTARHTSSLDSAHPNIDVKSDVVRTETYAIPPASTQKALPQDQLPLLSCLNDKTPLFADSAGNTYDCAQALILGADDPYPEVQGLLDSNDSRMQQVWLVKGMLLGALDTAVTVKHGGEQAGIAWFAFDARTHRVLAQDYLAVADNNVNYPAIATLPNGRGVMAMTLTGDDYTPSAAYARITPYPPFVGPVQVAAAGAGAQDGFSEYKVFSPYGNGVPRPRWGDYGAATVDGSSLWFASEYVGQSCTYDEWLADPTCGGTRGGLINWGTRISQLTP